MLRRLGMVGAVVVLAGCQTPIERARERIGDGADAYSTAQSYRVQCDRGKRSRGSYYWLYLSLKHEPGATVPVWIAELKTRTSAPGHRRFTEAHALGGHPIAVEQVSEVEHCGVGWGMMITLSTPCWFEEDYRLALDEQAVEQAARSGLDVRLDGVNGYMQIACEPELFRALQERVGGE